VVVTRDGGWVGSALSGPSFVTFDGGRPAGLDALIRQLGADDFEQRERATRALEVQAKFLRPWMLSAEKEADAETVVRIKRVLKAAGVDRGFQIGGATLKFTDGLRALDDRRVLITGHDEQINYRSFVVSPGGDSIEVDPSVRFRPTHTVDTALVTGGGDRVWVPRTRYDHAALLDLKTGKVTDTLPDVRFNWLHAVKADGTLFAGPAYPFGGQASRPIMVYQPGALDDVAVTPTTSFETANGAFCVAADGAVWAERTGKDLARFDGKNWTPVSALAGKRGVWLLMAGSNGEVLFGGVGNVGIVSGDNVVRAATFEQLIEQNRDAVARAFPAANPDGTSGSSVRLFADPAGNVWLTQPVAKVLTRAGWQDLQREARAAAGKSFQVLSFVPIGDGSRVLILQVGSSRGSLVARVADGKLVFEPLRHAFEPDPLKTVRDGRGTVYLSGKPIRRLRGDGKDEDLAVAGSPRFCDDDDNLWLLEDPLGRPTELSVWKSGKLVQKLTVPFFDRYDRFVADGHGSVYIHTNAGLVQFLRKDGKYELVKTHRLTEVRRGVREVYSPLGFLVTSDLLGLPGESALNVVELTR
jgi:hypothetical protein